MIYPDVAYAWRAFWDLNGSRSMGWGIVGGIWFPAVVRYAERYPIPDEFEVFHRLVKALDDAYLERVNARGRGSPTTGDRPKRS